VRFVVVVIAHKGFCRFLNLNNWIEIALRPSSGLAEIAVEPWR